MNTRQGHERFKPLSVMFLSVTHRILSVSSRHYVVRGPEKTPYEGKACRQLTNTRLQYRLLTSNKLIHADLCHIKIKSHIRASAL